VTYRFTVSDTAVDYLAAQPSRIAGNGCNLGKERDTELFVDHKGKDTHHGGTALVELNGTLLELSFGIERVPAKVNGAIL
jgi:hypothetical protein